MSLAGPDTDGALSPEQQGVRTDSPVGMPFIWNMFGENAPMQRLLLLAKMIDRVTSRHLQQDYALSVAQWRVLAFICIAGPSTASFIGDAAEVDQAEISRAVRLLVEAGLVTREFQPGSRKTMIIAPTDAGNAMFTLVRQRRQTYFAQVMDRLDDADKAALNRLLGLLGDGVARERESAG